MEELLAREFPDQFVVRQVVHDIVAVGEILDPPDALRRYDAIELFVGLRVPDDAEERGEAGAGAEQEQRSAALRCCRAR